MKKILFYLLIISCIGIATSAIFFLFDLSAVMFSIQLFVCSLVNFSMFLSFYILKKENSKLFLPLFVFGLTLVFLYVFGVYSPEFLKIFWTTILSGITIIITISIDVMMRKTNKVLSLITRMFLYSSGVLVVLSLLFNFSDPTFYKTLLTVLLINSVLVVLSSFSKEKQVK